MHFLASIIAAILSLWGAGAHLAGSTITTINASDLISASRATINTNFSNLNSGKAELTTANTFTALNQFSNASTSLFSCYGTCYFGGTATDTISQNGNLTLAGSLTLNAALTVANGGTGWAALQSNTVLLGNGTNKVSTTTQGTNGFVLALSAGVPTWVATTTLSTITGSLGVSQGGTGWTNLQSNTVLLGNGTGAVATTSAGTNGQILALSAGVPTWVATSSPVLYNNPNVNQTSTNAATTTVLTIAIPANTINTTNKSIRFRADFNEDDGTRCQWETDYGTGNATSSFGYTLQGGAPGMAWTTGEIFATSTTGVHLHSWSEKSVTQGFQVNPASSNFIEADFGTTTVDITAKSYLSFAVLSVANATCRLQSAFVEVLSQ